MTSWVCASEALIVSMLHHGSGASVTDGFDHVSLASEIYTTAQDLLQMGSRIPNADIVVFTDALVRWYMESHADADVSMKYVVFIDEIGLFLTNVSSALTVTRSHLKTQYPPQTGRFLSVLRAIRHAGSNLQSSGFKVVVIPLGTEAGALNCQDFPKELDLYRPKFGDRRLSLPFEYLPLISSTVLPPCIIRGKVFIRSVNKAPARILEIKQELSKYYGSSKEGTDAERFISSRGIWPSFLSKSDSLHEWVSFVKSKVINVAVASPPGSFGLLLAGLGPNLSSEFSSQLLRHGFARVARHPSAFTVDDQGLVTLDLTQVHKPLQLINPRDPLMASTLWRLVISNSQLIEPANITQPLEWLRSNISLPFGASGLGVTFGEPLGILHLLVARANATLDVLGDSRFVLPPVRIMSVFDTLNSNEMLSDRDSGVWDDVYVSFTHVVDLPTTPITVETLHDAYIDGVMFRMPSGAPNIDYLAVAKRGDQYELFGIQVRTGKSAKGLRCMLPLCLTNLMSPVLDDIVCNYLLVSLCKDPVGWQDGDSGHSGYLDLKGDIVEFLYTAAEERRRITDDRHLFGGQGIYVKFRSRRDYVNLV
eukprot:gnl/Dysnectes_brevis/4012_a5235_805.p1 GENE.gnl/Dysnectes_brevis/4012_a5235_805~~gnl/Dysnectes_brevis/4012_a5235_805.p1  ORF type:complete len:593 (-),score=45.29 gnl/Dysnectes_brevis/4012_a5235_805:72-1850(-)